jgi:L-iditol 2-dehydrogenase
VVHLAANRRSAAASLSRVAYDVSDRILAAVMAGPHQPIDIREFDRPALPPGAALLRTARSEVCGTDVHLHHGRLAGVPYPIIPGHVNCGRVLEVNGSLTDIEGRTIEVGTLVTFFDVFGTCGNCCSKGR